MDQFSQQFIPVFRFPAHQIYDFRKEQFAGDQSGLSSALGIATPLEGVPIRFAAGPKGKDLLLTVDQDLNMLCIRESGKTCRIYGKFVIVEGNRWLPQMREKLPAYYLKLIKVEILSCVQKFFIFRKKRLVGVL